MPPDVRQREFILMRRNALAELALAKNKWQKSSAELRILAANLAIKHIRIWNQQPDLFS